MGKQVVGYAAFSKEAPLGSFSFERRDLGPHDVQIEILFCGVCHSDLHTVRGEWHGTVYPAVVGHEIIGKVTATGKEVTSFKVGDFAGVGPMVDSCRSCASCKEGLEQYCKECIGTYNSKEKQTGKTTYGGYSTFIVVDEKFVLHIPKEFKEEEMAAVAPLLCAGITTYSPLRHWKVGKGSKVGVVGLGGLGHMAVKIAHALGAHVVLFTSSQSKVADAKRLGADEVIISKNVDAFNPHWDSFDFILDTVAAPHNLDMYLGLLKRDGTLCLVGAPQQPHPPFAASSLIGKRRSLAGSLTGGIKESQEMLDFCAKHHILCDIEKISMEKINEAYERMLKSDVKYRFVIDIASLKNL